MLSESVKLLWRQDDNLKSDFIYLDGGRQIDAEDVKGYIKDKYNSDDSNKKTFIFHLTNLIIVVLIHLWISGKS